MSKSIPLMICCGLIILSTCAMGQKQKPEYAVSLIADSLKENALEVIREYHMAVESDGNKSYEYTEKMIITILSEESRMQSWSDYYDKDKKIKQVDIALYDSKGELIRKVKNDEIQDESAVSGFSIYDDNRVLYVGLEHSDYPFTIEYSVNAKQSNFHMYYPVYFQYSHKTAIEFGSYELKVPQGFNINQNILGDVDYSSSKSGNETVHVWKVESQKCRYERTLLNTSPYNREPAVFTQPEEIYYGGVTASSSNWVEWGKLFYELNKNRDKLSEKQKSEILEVIRNKNNSREQIAAIYKYLQDQTRYVSVQIGVGGLQAFPASYVEENQYGDCKALSNYMKGLLSVAGIKAYLTKANLGNEHQKFYEDYPTQLSFNHMMLYVPEEDMFLECTSSDYPAGYVGAQNHDKKVLVLTENGGVLKTIPTPAPEENIAREQVSIDLKSDGSAMVEYSVQAQNEQHEFYRELTQYPVKDVKDYFQRQSELPAFEFRTFEVAASDLSPEAELNASMLVDKLGVATGPRMFVSVNPVSPFENYLQSKESKFNIETKSGSKSITEIRYTIPENYKIENLPKATTIEDSRYGYYSLDVDEEEGQLVFTTEFLKLPLKVTS